MRINVPRSICSLIYVSDDLFCCRLCNRQKTAAPNVIIINTFSQNLPDFLQTPHLMSLQWYLIFHHQIKENSDLFRFFSKMMKYHQTVIKSRSELKVTGSLSKNYFNSIKKLNKFWILLKILRKYGLKLEVREEEKART